MIHSPDFTATSRSMGAPGSLHVSSALVSRTGTLEQPCLQVDLRSGQRLRHGTVLLGVQRIPLKRRLVDARNVGLGLQLDPGDGEPFADLLQGDFRAGLDARRREARTRKLRSQCHREAPGVGSADQLLRVGGCLAFLESRLERIRAVEGAAADSQPPAPFGQIALPFRFCLPCWHGTAFRFAIVLGFTLRRAQWPEYDKYQAGTKRDIPVVLLSPR